MKVVVIGAGFAGLAAAYYLGQAGIEVQVWDPKGVAGGASGAAAGLLHLYAGIRSRRQKGCEEALAATKELIDVAGEEVILQRGLERRWTGRRTERAFRQLAKRYEDVILRSDGIWIPDAYAIDCRLYCERLMALSGALLVKKRAESLAIEADHILIAAGWESSRFSELETLSTIPVKGQLVRVEWNQPPLPHALGSAGYVVMARDGRSLLAGATFEHDFSDELPTQEAETIIQSKVSDLIPWGNVIERLSGIRCTTPDHRPIARVINDRISVLTGLGSKGLLWHALLAKQISQSIAGMC